jgi:hypothetical protein
MTKPNPSITIYLLTITAAAGLVAQFLAARAAFALITSNPIQPIAAAALIELAAVIDALVLARSRNPLAGAGLIVALVVSATYNYTQAAAAANGLSTWQLYTLSIGPLAALVTIALALGQELRNHADDLAAWHQIREDQRKDQLDYDRHEERLARRRDERWLRTQPDRTPTDNGTGDRSPVPKWPDKHAYLSDPDRPTDLTAGQLAELTGRTTRTARRWISDAQNHKQETDDHAHNP